MAITYRLTNDQTATFFNGVEYRSHFGAIFKRFGFFRIADVIVFVLPAQVSSGTITYYRCGEVIIFFTAEKIFTYQF